MGFNSGFKGLRPHHFLHVSRIRVKLDLEKMHVKEKPLRDMSVSVVQYGPSKHLLDKTDCPLPSSMYRIYA